MKARFSIPLTLVLGLCLALSFELGSGFPSLLTGLEAVYAQGSDMKFWVFDGHMHPTSSRQSGNMGDADYSSQFTLPKAIEGAIAIESDLGVLRMLHRLGLREMNLVHNLENNIGDVMYTTKNNGKGPGLTAYGDELVTKIMGENLLRVFDEVVRTASH